MFHGSAGEAWLTSFNFCAGISRIKYIVSRLAPIYVLNTGSPQINASIYLSAPSHQPHQLVPAIQAPVLFIAAQHDRVCPAAKIIETSKRALKAP